MRLELFTSETCANCRALKKNLRAVLGEIGEDYERVVSEKSIEDSEVMAELLMLNVDSVPVIRIGGEVFEWGRIKERAALKKILMEYKK
ncbi:MAG: thioredoxin family protein [Candidatus Methanosuratincola sp.]